MKYIDKLKNILNWVFNLYIIYIKISFLQIWFWNKYNLHTETYLFLGKYTYEFCNLLKKNIIKLFCNNFNNMYLLLKFYTKIVCKNDLNCINSLL